MRTRISWPHVAITAVCTVQLALASDKFVVRNANPKEIQLIREALRSTLKDPDSARLQKASVVTSGSEKGTFCAEVNAKNSYGGYTGYRAFTGLISPLKSGELVATVVQMDGEGELEIAGYCSRHGFWD